MLSEIYRKGAFGCKHVIVVANEKIVSKQTRIVPFFFHLPTSPHLTLHQVRFMKKGGSRVREKAQKGNNILLHFTYANAFYVIYAQLPSVVVTVKRNVCRS